MRQYLILLILTLFTNFASSENVATQPAIVTTQCTQIYDPFETFNRKVLLFNITIDKTILSPITHLYQDTVPQWPQDRVASVFTNLTAPLTFVNFIFQGNIEAAGNTFGRFLLNSTIGLGGLIDWASTFDIEDNPQTFSSTLEKYGNPYGAYIVLPLLGPSTTRGVFGLAIDTVTNPVNLALSTKDVTRYNIAKGVNTRIQNSVIIEVAEAALDPYSYTRSSYLQYLYAQNPNCKNINNNINYESQ